MRISRPRLAIYGAFLLLPLFFTARAALADPGTGPGTVAEPGAAAGQGTVADQGTVAAADHVITGEEIQSRLDQKVHSEEADRQAIRDLLSRPEVRRIAGSAGLSIEHASAAIATLSGPELTRLAKQAREADSAIVGGRGTVTMTWTTVIIVVVALVVLIAVL